MHGRQSGQRTSAIHLPVAALQYSRAAHSKKAAPPSPVRARDLPLHGYQQTALLLNRVESNYMQHGQESKHRQQGQLFVMVSSHLVQERRRRGGSGRRGSNVRESYACTWSRHTAPPRLHRRRMKRGIERGGREREREGN